MNAELGKDGLLRSCVISGHAGAGSKGGDVVCAAVSALARTAVKVLGERKGLEARGEALQRGSMSLKVGPALREADRVFLSAAGAFLLEGLGSVAAEYPQNCTMSVTTER
ncbi:MAG: ribosomal-processing cysteine protease Prp [Treponema sp.]|nr:ribosomal-processing cysteine protease Prp [Treponema sp.]